MTLVVPLKNLQTAAAFPVELTKMNGIDTLCPLMSVEESCTGLPSQDVPLNVLYITTSPCPDSVFVQTAIAVPEDVPLREGADAVPEVDRGPTAVQLDPSVQLDPL